jgi:hypothetical protein
VPEAAPLAPHKFDWSSYGFASTTAHFAQLPALLAEARCNITGAVYTAEKKEARTIILVRNAIAELNNRTTARLLSSGVTVSQVEKTVVDKRVWL